MTASLKLTALCREHSMKPCWLSTAVGCLLPVAALAQVDVADTAAAEPTASPRELQEDVQLLGTLATLELSAEQIVKIIPSLEQIQQHLVAIAARRTKVHGRQRSALERARGALIRGDRPSETTYTSIQRALRQLQLATQSETQKILQVEARIEGELTEQQLALIETREQREARLARVRELEGETTAAGYIVKQLTAIRELLPDQYARIRLRLANEIAVKTEGPRSSRFNAYRQRALTMLDDVYGWTVVQFEARLPTLAGDVREFLPIRPEADAPSAEGLIPYEEYADVLRNPRTLELLREMLARRGGGAGA